MPRPVYVSHPASLGHDSGPGHPESAARIDAISVRLEGSAWHGFDRVEAPALERDLLEAVHDGD